MKTLEAKNITFSYKKNTPLIKDMNFKINSDEVIGLFGDSGCGKSTFSKIMTGYIPNYTGSVTINKEKITSKFNPVQLIFQHPEKVMNPQWKMKQILEESWNPPSSVLDEFGIKKEWFKRYPSELSGGELQRFSILRALNPKTQFIIADEITTMLDAITQVQIWTSLLKYANRHKIGIVAVSHDMSLLNRICDDIIYFNKINSV